jgi:hypothetical protein
MFGATPIAQQLRTKDYDVISVVADPALVGLPDDQALAYATTEGRAVVTATIKDFIPLETLPRRRPVSRGPDSCID